jgi:hypothetical protein
MGESLYVLPVAYEGEARTWQPVLPEQWYTFTDSNGNGRIDFGEAITGLLYATAADSPERAGRTGDSFDRSCAGCHATGLSAVRLNPNGEFVAEHEEPGVGCESCHGPGALHVINSGGRELPDRAIVNPARLTAAEQRDICMSCHTRGKSVGEAGGQALDYPWRADSAPFVPGQLLSEALVIATSFSDRVHDLQGSALHMGQACQICHTGHNTTNRSLVRMTVDTPSSGSRDVVFTARSGPPGSGGLLGDATDGQFTDICEVCHTGTRYFRNDGSQPDADHNNGAACTDCHEHSRGFGGVESGGGVRCDLCHLDLASAMGDTSPLFRHTLDDSGATYPTDTSTLNCLSCHADHDLFGPDDRAANLRTDIAQVPTAASGTASTDFRDAGSGGICLSCHAATQSSAPAIPYAAPEAEQVAAYAGNMMAYVIPSDFRGGGEATFFADCSKCHNDDLDPKSSVGGQGGAFRFGLHGSTRSGMLSALGFSGSVDPLEEEFCYRCHATASDPIGGSTKPRAGRDWYGIFPMSARAEGIWSAFGDSWVHPIDATKGRHTPTEGTDPGWNPAGARHVECADCHNPHAAGPPRNFNTSGRFAQPLPPSALATGTPLSGVWGVDVPSWPSAWTAPDPSSDYLRVEASTFVWQVCLKCHSGFAYASTPPSGQTDQALEFNPNNASYHAVIGSSRTTAPPNSSFVSPWTKSSPMSCADCHTSSSKSGAQGPHGSAHRGILAGPFNTMTGQRGTESHLCFKCHDFNVYGRDGTESPAATGFSGDGKNLHAFHAEEEHFSGARNATCTDCHAAIPHGWRRRGLLVVSSDPAPYNSGAALSSSDVAGWPSSGNWEEESCDSSRCH